MLNCRVLSVKAYRCRWQEAGRSVVTGKDRVIEQALTQGDAFYGERIIDRIDSCGQLAESPPAIGESDRRQRRNYVIFYRENRTKRRETG